jgi:uncharacterized glyoxalase superfamily protein PhnB
MPESQVVVSLPIADRPTSHAFYGAGLGFEPLGELAADGVPEPLQFDLNDGLRIMLVPTGGFGWVIGEGREVAPPSTSECVLSIAVPSHDEVRDRIERARAAGATVVGEPGLLPWGEFAGTFTDPDGHLWMVIAVADS